MYAEIHTVYESYISSICRALLDTAIKWSFVVYESLLNLTAFCSSVYMYQQSQIHDLIPHRSYLSLLIYHCQHCTNIYRLNQWNLKYCGVYFVFGVMLSLAIVMVKSLWGTFCRQHVSVVIALMLFWVSSDQYYLIS